MSKYEEVKYNDLKKLAKERNLEATGTKEDLIARLEANDGGEAVETPAPEVKGDSEQGAVTENETNVAAPEAPQEATVSPQEEKVAEKDADRALRADAKKMKENLDKQPKVRLMIPFEAGEKPESGKKVPFHVNLNGYAMDFPRGEFIDVPEQVAQVIFERMESEGRIGEQWRIDRDASKQEALNG